MTEITSKQSKQWSLQSRLTRLVFGVVMVTFILIGLVALFGIRGTALADASREQELILTDVSQELDNQINLVSDDVRRIASRPDTREFARQTVTVASSSLQQAQQDMLGEFISLLEQNPNYVEIRYVTRSGSTWTRAYRGDNIVGDQQVYLNQLTSDEALTAAVQQPPGTVVLGQILFATDAAGRRQVPAVPLLRVATPVTTTSDVGSVAGVIEVDLDMRPLLNRINQSSYVVASPDRRLVLVNALGQTLADSETPSATFPATGVPGQSSSFSIIEPAIDTAVRNLTSEVTGLEVEDRLIGTSRIEIPNSSTMPWTLILSEDKASVVGARERLSIGTFLVLVVVGAGLSFLTSSGIRRLLQPLSEASRLAEELIESKDPNRDLLLKDVDRNDEVGRLVHAFYDLTNQIRGMSRDMDREVDRYTRNIEIAARIGRETATLYDVDQLLNRSIDLIVEEFGFYHAQVFLVDDVGLNAVLFYSYGERGQRLLEQRHKIGVGSDSVIGLVTASGRHVVVNDTANTDSNVPHRYNPLLPETRAELALPMQINDQVIGALDVQSRQPNIFQDEDIRTFQLLADQVALALHNARLLRQSEERIVEIDTLNQTLTKNAWELSGERGEYENSYSYDLFGVEKMPDDPNAPRAALSAPIVVRGASIGDLEANPPEGLEFTEGDRVILNAVAERVALAIENARLFQETQASLAQTSVLYQISRYMNEADTLEDIIQAIIISVMPDATSGQVGVFDEYSFGEEPEWMEFTADWSLIESETRGVGLTGLQLHLQDHMLLNEINPTHVTLINDMRTDERMDDVLRAIFEQLDSVSVVIIPFSVRGIWRGMIFIEFPDQRDFSEREGRIYSTLIDQVGVAIDNRLLLRQTEMALSQIERLYSASRIINTAQTPQDLVRAAITTINDPRFNFLLGIFEGEVDDTGWPNHLRVVARSISGVDHPEDKLYEFNVPTDSLLRLREPQIIVDRNPEQPEVPSMVRLLRAYGDRFAATFPLFSANQPLALFLITSEEQQDLTNDDYDVYRALTGQMSTVLQNRRLLEQTENALAESRSLYSASRAITSAQDAEGVYRTAMAYLAPMGEGLNHIGVWLAAPEASLDAPFVEYVHGWSKSETDPLPTGLRMSREELPLLALLDEAGGTVGIPDIETHLAHMPRLQAHFRTNGTRSAMIAPLQSGGKWLGAVVAESTVPDTFKEREQRFIQAVADQVAIAVENRRLFFAAEAERQTLRSILETMPSGILVLDSRTYRPIQLNAQVEQLLGQRIDMSRRFTPEDYGMRNSNGELYPEEELPIFYAKDEPGQVDDAWVVHAKNDVRVDLLVNAAPIFDVRGEVSAIVATFTDISNLRRLESTLQENLNDTITLYEATRQLAEANTEDDILNVVRDQLMELDPLDGYVLLLDEETGVRLERSVRSSKTVFDLPDELLNPQRNVVVHDLTLPGELSESLRQRLVALGVLAIISMPMRSRTSRETPLGWLVLSFGDIRYLSPEEERLLTTTNDSASIALDNRSLLRTTAASLQDTVSLYSATTRISRVRNIEELARVLQGSLESMKPDVYAAYLYETNALGFQVRELFNISLDDASPDFAGMIDRHRELLEEDVFIENLQSRVNPNPLEQELTALNTIRSVVVMNLLVKGAPKASLILGFNRPRRFTDSDTRYLGSVADSASVIIDNILLLAQIQGTLDETSVLYQASRDLTDANTSQEILQTVVTHLLNDEHNMALLVVLSGADNWESENAFIHVAGSWQRSADDDLGLTGVTLNAEQFPAWRQLSSPEVLMVSDLDEAVDLSDMERMGIESLNLRSFVVMPMRAGRRAIGAILIGGQTPLQYNESNQRIFQSFAEQASLKMEAGRLLEQTERRARQLETSAEVSRFASTILDLNVLMPRVVDLIRDSFGYDHVQIFLMDVENSFAELRASTGEAGRQLLGIRHKLKRASQSVIGQVTEQAVPIIALDTADARVVHRPNPYLPNTRSEMAVPLIVKDQIVGALDVQSNQPNAFDQDDVTVLTTLAAQISVAIDNARLFDQAEQRASEMTFLFGVTTAAASAETLNDALQNVTMELIESLQSLAAAIYLPRLYEDNEGVQKVMLEPVAASGVRTRPAEMPLIEMTDDNPQLVGRVASTRNSAIIENVTEESTYEALSPDAVSAVVMPLTSGATLIGLVVLESDKADVYSQDTLTLLTTLSGTLSAIVQNQQLLEQVQEQNDALRQLDRLKSDFLANMSHELRTPLNSIIGFSRVILKGIDGPLTEMQEQDLNTIYTSGQHLLNLINDILDQAKLAANRMDLQTDYFDMKSVIDGVRSIGIGLVKDKPVDIYVEVASGMPKAYGDEFRTRQILLNLVSNAAKFTREGSITISGYTVPHPTNGRNMIRVDVTDSGIGIAEKDMPLLFEAFRQVDSSLTRTVGGTGLGLPIARQLTEIQGGQMTVSSEINVGSTFSITVPIEPAEEGEETDPNEVKMGSASGSSPVPRAVMSRVKKTSTLEHKTGELEEEVHAPMLAGGGEMMRPPMMIKRQILLIEDNPDMVDQFRRALQREGFDVFAASIPLEAEAMASGLHPTIIVMDVNFSNGQGWSILSKLKAREDTVDIPVIVVTLSDEESRAVEAGAFRFIRRPVTPDILVQAAMDAEHESRVDRILIIDDQPESVRLLQQILQEHGDYRVFSAHSGQAGIALVARRRPDLILLDLRMPEMDGFKVIEDLRANPETANIPIIVVTGETLTADERERLKNLDVMHKIDINLEAYLQFIEGVKNNLAKVNGA